MSQTNDRITQLEGEVNALRLQLEQERKNVLLAKSLNNLLAHGREVVIYVVNDERLTVEEMSESISAYGYSSDDFISGKYGWRDMIHPDDYQLLMKHVAAELLKDKRSFECEYRVLTKTAEIVWISCISAPRFDAEGKITHFLTKIKDINERKQYEEKLRDANEKLFVTLKSIGEAVIQVDTGGHIEQLNSAAEKLGGIINLKAKNKLLSDIFKFCYSADFNSMVDLLKIKANAGRMVQIDEIFMQCAVEKRVYRVSCSISPVFFNENKSVPGGYVLVVKDLTMVYDMLQAAKDSEARMQKSESTIRGIFDHSVDGMLLADGEGIIKEWSSGYERISGLSKESVIGKYLWDVAVMGLPPEMQANEECGKLIAELKELVGNMRQKMIVRHVKHQEMGESRILNILYFPVAMPDGMMLGGISRDVSEEVRSRKLIEENERKLTVEKDRLQTLGDNMPNGCLYQFTFNSATQQMGFTYMSRSWETITGISVEDAMADLNLLLARMHPDDLPVYMQAFEKSLTSMEYFSVEIRFMLDGDVIRWGRISSTPHMEGNNVVWDGFIVDITDNKVAEQEVVAEKERLQALGDNMPNGCLYRTVTNLQTLEVKFVYVSGTFEHLLNISPKDALRDFSVIAAKIHPDDLPAMMRNIAEAAQERIDYNDEVRFYYDHTNIRWIQISAHPHMEDDLLVYDGFILDITDRKVAEQSLLDEKNRLQTLGDNMPDGCLFRFMMNTQTRHILGFTYLSRTWEVMTGIPVENTLADFESTLARVHPDDFPRYVQSVEESAVNMSRFAFEFRFRCNNGNTIWLKASSSPRMEEEMVVWDGFIVDITERKLAEQALIAEKDRLQALGDYFPNGCLFRFNFDGNNRKFSFSYLSKTWEELSNITLEDALRDIEIPLSKIHPDDRGPLVERIWETFDSQQENFDTELRFFYTPDELRWVQISTHRHFENGQMVSDGFILDITDRKNAGQQLMVEKERLETLGDNLPGGTLFRYRSRNLQEYMVFDYVSATWEKITGVSAGDVLKDVRTVFAHVHPDDFPAMMEEFDESAVHMTNVDTEARYLHPDGSVRWFHIASHPHYEGEFVVSDGFLIDVTERRAAEEKLAAERAKLKSLTDNIPNGCLCQFAIHPQTQTMRMAYMGDNWERLLNSPAEASMEDTNAVFSKVHEDDYPGFMTEVIRTTVEMIPFNVEVRYRYTKDDLRWLQISGAPHREGEWIIFDGMVMDITDRKKANQLLLAEKERVETLGNNLPNGSLFRFKTYHETQVMSFEYVSATWERTTGVSAEKTLEDVMSVMGRIHPDDMPELGVQLYNSCVNMSNVDAEARYLHPDGSVRWLHIATHPHMEDGAVVSDGFLLDITDRKCAERELLSEKERLQALGDNMPDGTLFRFKMDLQTQIMSFDYLSGTWEKISGVSVEDSLADIQSIFTYVHPDDLARLSESINTSVQTLKNIDEEIRYLHPNGSVRWYQISSHPHCEGNVVYSDGFILNVTSRKNAEQELRLEKDRLEALGNNIPGGCLYRFSLDPALGELKMMYASATWDEVTGVSTERAMKDVSVVFERVYPEDYLRMMEMMQENIKTLSIFNMELRFSMNGETRWLQMISRPHTEDHLVVWDGILLDITWRKEAERKLVAEKERLEAVGNNLPEGSLYRLVFDRDTNKMYMEYVSATWETVTGLTPESVYEDMASFFGVVHPDDVSRLTEASDTSRDNLTNANVEIRLNNKGNLRWIQIASHPHTEGNKVVWDGIMTDVTRRKEAERELETEKDRLQALGDNIPGGCLYRFILNTQTEQMHVSYVSATWETVTGVSADVALADITSVFNAVYPDDLPILQQSIVQSAQTLTNFNCEIRVSDHGRPRWVQMASHPHLEGADVVWDGIILDVTRRKEAERELMTEKDRLQALGDNLPGGTLFRFEINAGQLARSDAQTWLQHLRLSYAGATWEKISNTSLEDAMQNISLPFMKIESEDLAEIIPQMYESLTNLVEFNAEIRYHYTDTGIHWLQIAAVPRRENDSVMTDGFILDITERKKNENELAEYRQELERLVKERTEEMEATNEELYATNEEFAVTNEELHTKNDQLRNEITARKEIMQKLEDSENKVRNFIHQSFEGIMMLDNEGRVIEWNEALEQITGLSHDNALGKYEWDLLRNYLSEEERKPETFEKLRQSRLDYLHGGREQEPVVEEPVLYLPDGNKRYLQASMFPIGLADTCFFGRVLRDITEQKLADIELEQYRTQLEQMVELKTRELMASQERLVSLSNNLPGGVIYQMMDKSMTESWFSYISGYFEDMFEISVEDVMADISLYHNSIYPEDQTKLISFYNKDESQNDIDVEYRIVTKSGKMKWIHMRSSHHSTDEGVRIWDGFMIDITDRKLAEQELENTRRQQAILIKVLQIVQSAENLPDALSTALAEMGEYTGVSRAYIFEKSADGTIVSNTYEWCNEGIEPAIDGLQNIPVQYTQQWFDVFDTGNFICTSDINTLGSEAAAMLTAQGIKSIVVLPLSANGIDYGFVGFDECVVNKEWEQSDVELLKSLSQIISTTTRRHRAETSIQLSQQTMRTVLDNIDANIFVTDFDNSKILFANKKIKELMGDNVEGKECWKVMQPDKTEICDFCPRPHLRDKQNRPTGLYHWEHHNGNTGRWFENTDAAIEWIDGRLVQMEYSTDITDRKFAEEAVRQSEEMYRQLTVASPDAIVVCSPTGKIRYVSSKTLELFGVEDNLDVTTLRMLKFVHPHDRQQVYSLFGNFVKDNVSFVPQLLLVHENGSEFFGEISSAPVKDANGNTTSVIMVIRDVTQRKLSEMELIRAKEKAEESDKLKSAFLANMSHEIRTPLNGIVGFLNFLNSDNLSPMRRQEYINVINNSSAQLVKLIDDIIDVAKIEAKQMSMRPVPLHVNELMGELQVFFETYLHANNKDRIMLILDDSGFIDHCVTYADPMRLRQVLNNLIGNAVKFTEKGFIRIAYRQSAPNRLEFVVEDSGIGLDPSQREIIFERFRQAELGNSRQYGGTGLGLTISRSLVQMMGGEMWVESAEGVGSTFYFSISYLPVASEDEHLFNELSDKMLSADRIFNDKTILVVEPEVLKYKYYEQMLSISGASVIQAESLQQWIDFITQTNHIDAVVADASVFNNVDSDDIRQIKSVRAGLPMILSIPGQCADYQQVIRDSQCNMTLEEPLNYDVLIRALRRFVR